ncbi:sensor histidine kinase [Maribacter chungangensis]|uniref:histidine kinase n=1 Tax=Maribacter chungangensis TaxID=1069117 RepID=A0ABW3B5C6_9FLAO
MKKFEDLRKMAFGDRDKMSSERYFVGLTSFTAGVFSLVLCLFHIASSLNRISIFLAFGTAVVLFVLYVAVRFYGYLLVPKTILTVGGLLILDFTWYTKFLSNGPVLMFILIFAALILLLWNGRALLFLLVFYFINLCVLFYIDYNAGASLLEYPSEEQRSVDIFVSFTIYAFLLLALLYLFKQDFLKQKQKAIHSDALKSAFLANMNHEIRTPMNGILGFSDLLKNPRLTAKTQKEYLRIIESSGLRMLNVINDIMLISKIEAGSLAASMKPTDINLLLQNLYTFYKPEVTAKGMRLVCSNLEETGALSILTDEEKLHIVFTNLIKNAIKYTTEGTIEFGYHVKGTYIEFYVKDTGIGIVKERQKAIFERFIKANIEDVQARQGAGLGLSITKAYVELLNGQIWVESEFGSGSVFSFTLPFANKTVISIN